jgi:hypothetical protein
MQEFWHYNDAAYLILVMVLAIVAITILTFTWRESLRAIREFVSPLAGRRPKYRLIHLFVLLAACSFAIKIATLLSWSATAWVNAFSVLATIMLAASVVGCFICLFWADISERRHRLRGPDTLPQAQDEKTETGRQKRGKVRFADRRRPTTGFKW